MSQRFLGTLRKLIGIEFIPSRKLRPLRKILIQLSISLSLVTSGHNIHVLFGQAISIHFSDGIIFFNLCIAVSK